MARKIGILGAGTWASPWPGCWRSTAATCWSWSAIPKEVEDLARTRVPSQPARMVLPESLRFTKEIAEVCSGQDILVFAVPSVFGPLHGGQGAPLYPLWPADRGWAKGIEPETLFTMTEVLADELGKERRSPRHPPGGPVRPHPRRGGGPGPAHHHRVGLSGRRGRRPSSRRRLPTSVCGCTPNPDIKGVELSGALKNVIALGVGISTGLGYGDNARAALITRGIAEIARLVWPWAATSIPLRAWPASAGPDRHRHQPAQPQQTGPAS